MRDPIRVLVIEDRRSGRFIAQQLSGGFDVDFTWQHVASAAELRTIAQHFNPALVFCADELTLNSRSAALDMLRLLALRTAVIHVAEVDDMDQSALHYPTILESNPPCGPQLSTPTQAAAAGAIHANSPPAGQCWKSLPSLLDTSADPVAMSDSSGWITYANTHATRLLRRSRKQPIGTVLGLEHDFTPSGRGLHRLAFFDTATGLPNPVHLSDLVDCTMARARGDRTALPIVALDLQGLRVMNELSGRALSDEVLDVIVSELKSRAAECGMIARVGDDDILLVLPDASKPMDAAVNVRGNRRSAGAPERAVEPSSSAIAGAAPMPQSIVAPQSIVRPQSIASPARSAASSPPWEDPAPAAKPRLPVEAGLDDALQRHATGVHYQPQFELRSGRGCGVEALARWVLTSGESVAPAIFVPVAERAGMIDVLGASVLQSACNAAAAWRGSEAERLTVSVNVSTLQIHGKFFRTLAGILETSGLAGPRLELEIAEAAVLANADLTARCLKQWKELGVRVAVNHAGTNYSSLAYLSRLPVDRLKLDKSLVHNMTLHSQGAGVMHALICLGAEFGIDVIAEGVETEPQFQMLMELGCLQVQGYLLGRPMPAVQAQIALRKPWGNLPKSVLRPGPPSTKSTHFELQEVG